MQDTKMATGKEKILIVDDEEAIREMLGYTLMKAGYTCIEAGDVEEARDIIKTELPNLVLLDWMLPGMSGIDYARRLRSVPETKELPIIMLTARGSEDDKVRGLETGADDYITKPFSTKELLARVKTVLRRSSTPNDTVVITVEGLVLDPETYRVTANDEKIELSPTEFRLLHFFITHPERVYSRAQLLDQVWGENVYVEERTVDVHIRRLRKILEPFQYDRYIQTVRSVGYRFSTR
ncbi:MAG: two-component system phosphate regulon response regulator PhoB [Gammaproteobacteria bacterium]|jgi:two-component system phosphate regulon response regulator PhoB